MLAIESLTLICCCNSIPCFFSGMWMRYVFLRVSFRGVCRLQCIIYVWRRVFQSSRGPETSFMNQSTGVNCALISTLFHLLSWPTRCNELEWIPPTCDLYTAS